uniref:folate gamma-glutamyl hydrolase n=1 Tax=Neogobius melanostomus TaxID=47308 RepID=A0A8C6WFY5_9GOBI
PHTGCFSLFTPFFVNPRNGILAQENHGNDPSPYGTSYIAASYVKYIESAGARVVPIRYNKTEAEYEKLFNSINGEETVTFSTVGKFEMAISNVLLSCPLQANDAGDYFPLWGTCQGLQQLTVLTANKNLLTNTDTASVALPLTFTPAAQSSRLFRHFPKNLLKSLSQENITANFHHWSNYSRNAALKGFYKVLSTNTDGKIEFISTMEAYRYPIYAVQWHPEKTPFEWVDKRGMVHSSAAVQVSFYTASFFVSEARKSQHKFSSQEEEDSALIYNYNAHYKKYSFYFVQVYYFN